MLDKLPKRLQPEAKEKLHEIWMAPTKAEADKAFDLFVATYEAKYPKATLPPPIKTAADQSADVTRRTSRHRYTRAVGSVERELAAAFA